MFPQSLECHQLARKKKKTKENKPLHHLLVVDSELGGVHLGKAGQSESPALLSGSKGNSSLLRVNLDVTDNGIGVGCDDDVGRLDGAREGLVAGLSVELKLQKGAVHLVDHEHGLDTLLKSLAQDGFSLHTDTL